MHFSKKDIAKAKNIILYDFLLAEHGELFSKEGQSLRFLKNHSISIAPGYKGYYDFATAKGGNAIDFLTIHLNYRFGDAIEALLNYANANMHWNDRSVVQLDNLNNSDVCREFTLPKRYKGKASRVFAYLLKRGIRPDIINDLFKRGLLYQSEDTNNCVFVNESKDFAEIRGTLRDKSFHQILKTKKDNFWAISPIGMPITECKKILVCESAIDAISLMQIMQDYIGNPADIAYVSLGGVANQATIDRLISIGQNVVLAVDNDAAGHACLERNNHLNYIQPNIPGCKDWNDMLLAYQK